MFLLDQLLTSYDLHKRLLTGGSHLLQKLPCHKLGFLHERFRNEPFHFFSFHLSFLLGYDPKPPFKFSLPHPLHQIWHILSQKLKGNLVRKCVYFPNVSDFSLTHTHTQKKKIKVEASMKITRELNQALYLLLNNYFLSLLIVN